MRFKNILIMIEPGFFRFVLGLISSLKNWLVISLEIIDFFSKLSSSLKILANKNKKKINLE